jgi:hypothetical protein
MHFHRNFNGTELPSTAVFFTVLTVEEILGTAQHYNVLTQVHETSFSFDKMYRKPFLHRCLFEFITICRD